MSKIAKVKILVLVIVLVSLTCVCAFADSSTLYTYTENEISAYKNITPKFSNAISTTKGVQLSFDSIEDTNYYFIYRRIKEDKTGWKRIAVVNDNLEDKYVYYDTNVSIGSTYSYKLVAQMNDGVKSDGFAKMTKFSDIKTIVNKFIAAPMPKSVVSNIDSTIISWTKNSNVSKYIIFRASFRGGPYKRIGVVSGKSNKFIDDSIDQSKSKAYYYKLSIVRNGKISKMSNYAKGYTYGYKPKIMMPQIYIENQNGKTFLCWDKCDGASGYEFEIRGKSYNLQTLIDSRVNKVEMSYPDDNYTCSVSTLYQMNGQFWYSEKCIIQNVEIREGSATSISIHATLSNNGINITWSDIGSDSYELYCKKDNEDYMKIFSTSKMSINEYYYKPSLSGKYTFMVIGKGANSENVNSDSISVVYKSNSPTELAAEETRHNNALIAISEKYQPLIDQYLAEVKKYKLQAGTTTMSLEECDSRIKSCENNIAYYNYCINNATGDSIQIAHYNIERTKAANELTNLQYERAKIIANFNLETAQNNLTVAQNTMQNEIDKENYLHKQNINSISGK